MTTAPAKRSGVDRFLAIIERAGNALPHPATLFAILALLVMVLSAIASAAGLSALHPATNEPVVPVNLLSAEGLHLILTRTVTNFTGFAPLGTVLVVSALPRAAASSVPCCALWCWPLPSGCSRSSSCSPG
jgi:aminobenzoyl-glutamate transport protein